ncbi:MAG TPA: choice-of-anchor Q domain-containing protein [Thermoflexales bacterium]|nr:choice-of-anchor Q domain-containing protein [Thermoflexales bacterium]HQW34819.1 choice-of-anchor Q domain-containing protein [Thermoflexales bacterium]
MNKKVCCALSLACAYLFFHASPISANTSVGCDPNAITRANDLISAIQSSVTTGGSQSISLAPSCIYTLTQVNSGSGVDLNGLPVISNTVSLTITGNGATISRDPAAPQFRFLSVLTNSQLTLINLTLAGGHAVDGPFITVTASYAGDGGAILNAGQLTLIDSAFQNNRAGDNGCTVAKGFDCSMADFHAGSGGAISNSGNLTMVNTLVEGNRAGYAELETPLPGGGGIANWGSILVTGSTFLNNQAGDCLVCVGDLGGPGGGAIFNAGFAEIRSTNFLSNTARSSYMARTGGGAISFFGTGIGIGDKLYMTHNGSAFGSAINIGNSGSFTLTNSTLFHNNYQFGSGAESTVFYAGNLALVHVTLVPDGASTYAIESRGAGNMSITVNSSLITGLCDSYFSYAHPTSTYIGNYNVLNPSCVVTPTIPSSNLYTLNFGLDPAGPQNNGGATPSIALMPPSLAINFVPLSACAAQTSQNGVARPQGSGCDAGAYESPWRYFYLPNTLRVWASAW